MFGAGLLRGVVCGAALGAALGVVGSITTDAGSDVAFVMVSLAAFSGALVGVACAAGVLVVLSIVRRGRWAGSWVVSGLAALVVAFVAALSVSLLALMNGWAFLDPHAQPVTGAAAGAIALWQARRVQRD
ncbi:hypothetical protein GCM10023225_25100 [Kineococcus glutinatus]|uniref:Uncharacterized protein n=1 Tax=Kineococcus glutinatus TaxID=1070872 RepID=A0ABP9I1X8_9ACTN